MNLCKVCFKKIEKTGINSLFKKCTICQSCYNSLDVIFQKIKIDDINGIAIYSYNKTMEKLIFQFKGCFDVELKTIFLERHLSELRLMYKDYVIVPIPSHINSDKERGFNHVEEVFAELKLPIYPCLKKKYNFKQSDLSKREREKIINKLFIEKGELVKNKKVLLVDDVITTGSSLKAGINLLKKYFPKKIELLILCKK